MRWRENWFTSGGPRSSKTSAALSPWLVLGAMALYGLVHSLLASLSAKALAQRRLGDLARRGYRLIYNVFAVLSFLPVLALVAALPDHSLYSFPYPWVLLTTFLQGLAGLALLAGLLQTGIWNFMGVAQLFSISEEQPPHLVVRGLYRWVRHPLYSAGFVIIWLSPIMTTNLLALVAGASLYLVIGAWFEERKLLTEFGAAYLTYRQNTPMFVPFLRAK
jgi:protein-S-isoprenylcysteine O-methyltransferase Ste14